jgi:hypothetical protein
VPNEDVSIIKRIKREARTNPAKAAVLAALLMVALYFWAPLLWNWAGVNATARKAASEREAKPEPPSHSDSQSRAGENRASGEAKPSWQELQQWQLESPWAKPADLAGFRDPFGMVAVAAEMESASEEVEQTAAATPEQMIAGVEMRLTGTIVSQTDRVALIDGRAYREGDIVDALLEGTTWELEVRRIEPNRVTLGWQSIERELTAPKRQNVGRIELVGHPR